MIFTAILKRNSHIYREWRGARRVQGNVGGVVFRLVPGMDYASGTLDANQVAALRAIPACVQIEMTTITVLSEPPKGDLSYDRIERNEPIKGVLPVEPVNAVQARMPGWDTKRPVPQGHPGVNHRHNRHHRRAN